LDGDEDAGDVGEAVFGSGGMAAYGDGEEVTETFARGGSGLGWEGVRGHLEIGDR
jgi:hypothetical protein